MLWVDVDLDHFDEVDGLWRELGVEGPTTSLPGAGSAPALVHQNGVMRVNVSVIGDGADVDATTLHCVVGKEWIVTLHSGPLELVDRFNEPFDGHVQLGALDGPTFLSLVLDWQLSGYFELIERLQTDIDQLDEELLIGSPTEPEILTRLHGLRARVRELRSTLGPHRQVFGPLGHPESDNVLGADIAADYRRLDERLESALVAVDTAREMIVGSFDIFMTRTAQATNDIMKRLTVVSVLLLPAVVLAGVMGMNFRVAFFEHAWVFWIVLAAMGVMAGATFWLGKRRNWF
jgi:Mg2+ and Co2+ transporter CorA